MTLLVRKVLVLLLCVSMLTFLTSCWSAREIESLAIVAAIGVDQEGDQIQLTVQIIVGGSGGGGGESTGAGAPVWVTSAKGNSLTEALFNLNNVISKEPFFAHAYVLIIGEDMAKNGIAEIIDWVGRNRQLRDRVRTAVALGTAEDILKAEPKMTQLPAEYIEALLRIGDESGLIPRPQILYMRVAYANRPRMQIMLPLIQTQPQEESGGGSGGETPAAGANGGEGEKQKAEALELKGLAVFRDDVMVGTLDATESRGVAWLTGTIASTLVAINRIEGQVTQLADFASVKYSLKQDDSNWVLRVKVSQDGTLTAWPLGIEQGITPTILAQLEQDLSRVIEAEIRAALNKLQGEFNADIAGLGEKVRRLNSPLFKSLNWEQAFPELQVDIEVDASFRRVGLTK